MGLFLYVTGEPETIAVLRILQLKSIKTPQIPV